MIDGDGFAASFKDGRWIGGLQFAHERIAEFAPVKNREDILRLLDEAKTAVSAKGQ